MTLDLLMHSTTLAPDGRYALVSESQVASIQADAVREAHALLARCLETGAVRREASRELYLDVCAELGREPQ